MESTPLYGERKQSTKVMIWLMVVGLGLFALTCAIIGVVLAFKDKRPAHFSLLVLMVLAGVASFLMWRWYNAEQVAPKFKVIVVLLLVLLVLTGVASLWYDFSGRPPKKVPPPTCAGYWVLDTKTCVTVSGFSNCGLSGGCMYFNTPTSACCTSNCSIRC